jgi:peroxiredoxin
MRGSWVLVALMAATTAGLWFYSASRTSAPVSVPIIAGTLADEEKHRVTDEMAANSALASGHVLPDLRLESGGGESIDLVKLSSDQPVVLIFIKDGCPCSAAAEPFFRRLYAAYGQFVTFVGVIDGDRSTASRWVAEHGTPFPVFFDTRLELARQLGVTNSAYVAVVSKEGRVEKLYPGFSSGLLQELSRQIAALAGIEPAQVETSDAPAEPYTGCPFDLELDQDDSSVVEPRRPE